MISSDKRLLAPADDCVSWNVSSWLRFTCIFCILVAITWLVCGCGGPSRAGSRASSDETAIDRANSICARYRALFEQMQEKEPTHPARESVVMKLAKLRQLRETLATTAGTTAIRAYIRELSAESAVLDALSQGKAEGRTTYSRLYARESLRRGRRLAAREQELGLTACTAPLRRNPVSG